MNFLKPVNQYMSACGFNQHYETKHNFFEIGFAINNKPPLENVVHAQITLFLRSEEFILANSFDQCFRTYYMDIATGFLQVLKRLSKTSCLNKVTFPAIVVNILHYIRCICSFPVQPVRTIAVSRFSSCGDINKFRET